MRRCRRFWLPLPMPSSAQPCPGQVNRSKIRDALTRLRPIPGDCGDEYRRPPFLTATGDLSHHVESFPAPFKPLDSEEGRTVLLSGGSRAVRRNDHISLSATDATHGNRAIGGQDAVAQFHFVIDKIEGALQSLDGRLEDIVSINVYIHDERDVKTVLRAYDEKFRTIRPAKKLTQAKIEREGCLVEIQVEAIVKGTVR